MALTDLFGQTGTNAADAANSSAFNPLNMATSAQRVADGVGNYLLKPAGAKGLTGFIFDYEGETVVTHQSEITDHYSEQNTFLNDHAAQKPARITLRGFVGELVDNPNFGLLGALNTLQSKLTTLPATLGKYTPAVAQKIASGLTSATTAINKVDMAISKAQNVVGLILGGTPAATRQQKAYRQLWSLYQANAVFTLDTPFNYFKCVIIENMTFTQDADTKQWCEISVTVKEVRFVGNPQGPGLSPQMAAQELANRAAQQGQAQTNLGQTTGTPSAFDKLKSAYSGLSALGTR